MKSAYELAMERLEKHSPTAALSAAQKEQIAEIESIAKSKMAEKELFLKDQMAKAAAGGDHTGIGQLEQQLTYDLHRIQSNAEEQKEKVRSAKS
jgi:hypothetical protein